MPSRAFIISIVWLGETTTSSLPWNVQIGIFSTSAFQAIPPPQQGAIAAKASGKAIAEVISAAPLTNEQKDALTEKLSKMINKTVEAIYTVVPALIGGIKIEIEGKTYDGSINKKLHSIKEVIIG